jgi:hypothetical protein
MNTSTSIWDIIVEKQGVVSLLDMLEFSARDYIQTTYQIGLLLGKLQEKNPGFRTFGEDMERLFKGLRHLGLTTTREHFDAMMQEILQANPGKIWVDANGQFQMADDISLDVPRICHHFEAAYVSLRTELGTVLLRAVPLDKRKYCDAEWLTQTPLFTRFPEMVDEFQKAGRCFAYGENTACVFHLMRVTDSCLRKVSESLEIQYDSRNWHGIGETITRNMEQRYQLKTDEWKKSEQFYAEILTDIQAIGRAHRNPVLHELEMKYDEREALIMLTVIEGFATHVAQKLHY